MKILVFGAGVIGTTYAWQLWESGNEVSLLVRKHRLVRYSNSGINITNTNLQGKEKTYKKTVFRPRIVDRLDPADNYDLIIVAIRNYHLRDALPYIAKNSGKTHILFLGHFWQENELIEKTLLPKQFFYGFPGMVLGSQSSEGVNCYFFGNGNTFLSEPDGKISNHLLAVHNLFEQSGLQPRILHPIEPWIRGNFVWQAAMLGPVLKSENFRLLAADKKLMRRSVYTIREALTIARQSKVKVQGTFPFWIFRLPVFLVTLIMKRSFNPTMQAALEASFKHGIREIRAQYFKLLGLGRKIGLKTTHLASFEKYIKQEK